ncbi:MAG: c-type cytochrome [Pseudanabaenaceae cyanobacterium SKYGB_i_bin29]|nr:c-type cytochrome [Pseudanabaenaceae cyanobacterium SKYG29]MDW8421489.1 c-type cytochrome [Pseudanabaenaceae cyanobacterium SKYGB_i_bin29]
MLKLLASLFVLVSLVWQTLPAFASSPEAAKLFTANCAACHAGGGNRVVAAKTLQKDALAKYGMNTEEAIAYQIKKGKNAMPAFGKKLSDDQIKDVAQYVLEQAEKGWGKA